MVMNIGQFSFAQPLWLFGVFLIPMGWLWYKYCNLKRAADLTGLKKFADAKLLPHILLRTHNASHKRHYGIVYSMLVFCIVIALANPRWGYTDLDAYQSTASMVILLDLSATMNATDLTPSRIVRARQSIEDLLNDSRGLKIGLIGFAGNPHLISPITDDLQTIRTYIPALDTDLTNVQGDSLHLAFRMARDLLRTEPGEPKSILLISDGNYNATDFSKQLSDLSSEHITVNVLGIGTATGAPYKNANGALQKLHGKVVTSKLNKTVLQTIAKEGHGIYAEASVTNAGLHAILAKATQSSIDPTKFSGKIRQWEDRYYWFLIPAAFLMLYLVRQRVFYVYILAIICTASLPSNSYAFSLSDLFTNSAQKGSRAYTSAEFAKAADLFTDPYHKGVALYRDGQYSAAEEQFANSKRKDVSMAALYNKGNAQMQQKKWRAAISSYEAVLAEEPENIAARNNLEIAKKMLDQEDEDDDDEEDPKQCNNPKQSKDSGKEQSKQSPKDNQNKEQEQEQEQNQKKNQEQDQDQQDSSTDDKSKNDLKGEEQDAEQAEQQQLENSMSKEEQARAEQWLNRIDSDIKVFLKNKCYIEDVLSTN